MRRSRLNFSFFFVFLFLFSCRVTTLLTQNVVCRLEKSMDRFFAAMPVGKVVKRANWSISTNGELFCLAGNHMSTEQLNDTVAEQEDVDISKTVLRCERQTLHRLPQTRALVFAFVSRPLDNEDLCRTG
jgi:hypothetical protein